MKTILVTGGAGFIGSHFVDYLIEHTLSKIIVFDKLTYAGNQKNMDSFLNNERVIFLKGDITIKKDVLYVFQNYKIDVVYNFAAESHVDKSILNSSRFYKTNVIGVLNLLEISKSFWGLSRKNNVFVQISTDEVYGSLGYNGSFNEESNLSPNNPYSASKAAADLLCMSFYKTYDFPVIITRSTNNFGPRQHGEKFIPKIVRNLIEGQIIPIYGNGLNVREWIYVLDNCRAIFLLGNLKDFGEIYNIGGLLELSNIDLVKRIQEKIPNNLTISYKFVEDRPGHDFRYSLDKTNTIRLIGDYLKTDFDEAINKTISWYQKN